MFLEQRQCKDANRKFELNLRYTCYVLRCFKSIINFFNHHNLHTTSIKLKSTNRHSNAMLNRIVMRVGDDIALYEYREDNGS